MDKRTIKDILKEKFISEAANNITTPAISLNNKLRKDNAKVNKDGLKDVEKKVSDFEKGVKDDPNAKQMAPNKFNYDDDFEKTYHDEMEIMNGQEMIQYDSKPDENYTKRAEEAIAGSSRMGNNPEWANVVDKQKGFEGPDFGKNLIKKIKASTKKRNEQTPTLNLRGRDIQADLKDTGHKPYAIEESVNEMAAPVPPISEKNRMVITNWIEKIGTKQSAEKLINAFSQTGMVSDFPDSIEYGTGLNKIEALLSKQDFDKAFYIAKNLAKKLEKKAMKDMGLYENKDTNNTPIIKQSMKRLKFKNEFKGLNNALKLIPENYKVDSKEFEMTDGNESYKIRWEGTVNEGRAIVLTANDKKLVNEDILRMKALFGYKSQDTLGLVKGNARINENNVFGDIWGKSKQLLGESEEIEGADAAEGNWDDETKKAPEATKHVQGSVSKDKGTQAPAAKEGDLDDAVSQAPEAKKHVEGSASTEKGTQAPKPKEGHWEDTGISQASEAKKHVHLKENEVEEDIMEMEYEMEEDIMEDENVEEKVDIMEMTYENVDGEEEDKEKEEDEE
jgi:hypothetical protein